MRVNDSVDSGDDASTIYTDDILEIVKVEARSNPRSSGVQPMLIAVNSLGEKLSLPPATPGKFSSQLDVKWYSMAEIVTKGDFPVRVQLVHTHPGYQISAADKFTIQSTRLSKNVLVTVNKELLAMPIDTEIEVKLKDDLQNELPMPDDDLLVGENSTDSVSALPPPPDDLLASSDSTTDNSKPVDVEPPEASDSVTELSSSSPAKVSSAGGRSIEKRKSLLTEIDSMRLRLGSVRTFGTSKRLSTVVGDDDDMSSMQPKPEQVREMFRNLQERTAETLRLQEEANKWQARCQRLNSHHQSAKKLLTDHERTEMFWRYLATNGSESIDAATQKSLDEYRITEEDVSAMTAVTVAPKPQAAPPARQASKPSVSVKDLTFATLSLSHVQQLLDALNMAQYKEKFAHEQVDGGLLLELDEESLESEIGMKSALHRKKIMRTISGKGNRPLEELLTA